MKTILFFAIIAISNLSFAQDRPWENAKSDSGESSTSERPWRFGVGGSLSLSSKLRFTEGRTDGFSGTFEADLDYTNALSLEFEARNTPDNSWGVIGGLTYDFERKFDGGTIKGGGQSATLSAGSDPSKLQMTVLYANAVYRWNEFYLPFGLNISLPKYTPPNSYTGTSDVKGGLGVQLGVGFYFTEHFVGEIVSRAAAVKMSGVSSTGTKTDYGTGFFSTLMFTGKYLF